MLNRHTLAIIPAVPFTPVLLHILPLRAFLLMQRGKATCLSCRHAHGTGLQAFHVAMYHPTPPRGPPNPS